MLPRFHTRVTELFGIDLIVEEGVRFVETSGRNPARVLRNTATATVQALEKDGAGIEAPLPHISGTAGRKAYVAGDWTRAALSVGQAVAFADRIEPLAVIIRRFETEAEAEAALARLGRLT